MSQTKLISLDNLTRYDRKIKQLITTVTPASATPESVASAGSVGTSTKYAREDHTHAISVATGDANGQVKIAGQNASVKGFNDKQDKYTSITYAQWQALTPAQKAAKDYYISDYPSSAITAGNVSYNNSSSGMSADDVQEAVDELKSGLTNSNAVNAISIECGYEINSIRATFNNKTKYISFDVRANSGFDNNQWSALIHITDSTVTPTIAQYFPVVFIPASRNGVIGYGVGKLDTDNYIYVYPKDNTGAYSEAVSTILWQ